MRDFNLYNLQLSDIELFLNVAKYGYIKANYDVKNPTTVSYLSELAKINYKDSAALYDDLCVWTIDIVANSSSTGTENLTSISKYKRFYFKITAWGKFGESLDTKIQLIYTNGLTKDYTANFTYNKTASIDYFEPYMSPGLATVNVYKADTNELLKTHSVELLP